MKSIGFFANLMELLIYFKRVGSDMAVACVHLQRHLDVSQWKLQPNTISLDIGEHSYLCPRDLKSF